ncbi:MAG: hypothetical protein OQK09_13910 [Colwellia sp.]|nr:hypothetical protein [Colwellia sp.]MCW8866111.1 hypothetical protein [Colwellia sp.]MCW9082603.1 hypothetical protein [Colwellia sp.]
MSFFIPRHVLLMLTLFGSINLVSATDIVRYVDSIKYPDPKQRYFIDLLTLTLDASKEEFGDYQLQPVAIEMSQGRTSMMLQRNEYIDLTWRMTSQALEQKLQAIYFPLLKGLMGHRIFIIRKSDQARFAKDLTLASLKKINLGQGHNWPDTDILIANGFNVTKANDIYLLEMLKKSRFDYFPRGLHEPWLEINNQPELVVETNLMLRYPAPIFFFVNKQNKRLQKRLTLGLAKLLDSGEFEHFFLTHPITTGILTKTQVSTRTIFELKNPLLSQQVKKLLTDERLWINNRQNE